MTVIVSSHLLSEIDQLADDIGIIANGKMRYQGALSNLHETDRNKSLEQIFLGSDRKGQELMIRLIKCEYKKTKRKHLFLTAFAALVLMGVWAFYGASSKDMSDFIRRNGYSNVSLSVSACQCDLFSAAVYGDCIPAL